ncbi:hypothetical protein ACIQ6R_35320 [Streptomyces sp. NPDC096048]
MSAPAARHLLQSSTISSTCGLRSRLAGYSVIASGASTHGSGT